MKQLATYLLNRTKLGVVAGKISGVPERHRRFTWRHGINQFHGVFPTETAALAAIPVDQRRGWDTQDLARFIIEDSAPQRVDDATGACGKTLVVGQTSTFAVLMWLSRLTGPATRILDVGGAGGILYWLYTRYFAWPPTAHWTVLDMTAFVERGRQTAAGRIAPGLLFTDDPVSAGDCDILVASGCVQYMSNERYARLLDFSAPPQTIIISKIALTDGPEFWTLQNLAHSVSTYRVFNRTAFLAWFETRGYSVRDEWSVPEIIIDIPFYPDHRVGSLSGFVLQRKSPTVAD